MPQYTQLQFSFMKDVNLRSYLRHQLDYFKELYQNHLEFDVGSRLRFTEFVNNLLETDAPIRFRDKFHREYFGDLDSIVEDTWHQNLK